MFSPYTPPEWSHSLSYRPTRRVTLAHLPTPIESWEPPGFPEGTTCLLKRDDYTGFEWSGNKIRKLGFLLADAAEKQADSIITCGGIQSNHCRATSVASRRMGLAPYVMLRTATPEKPTGNNGNLFLSSMVGAQIIPISQEQYRRRNELMNAFAEDLRAKGKQPYVIPEGASNGIGTWGYLDAIEEIATQLQAENREIDDLIIACGSGGTAAGLALGVYLKGLPWKVHAINVCDDADYFYAIVNRIFAELGADCKARECLHIIDGYKGLGYAKNTPEEIQQLQTIAEQTGVIFDPVYSGKAFLGLRNECNERPSQFKGKRLMFIHTGGMFGWFAKLGEFSPFVAPSSFRLWSQNR